MMPAFGCSIECNTLKRDCFIKSQIRSFLFIGVPQKQCITRSSRPFTEGGLTLSITGNFQAYVVGRFFSNLTFSKEFFQEFVKLL